MKEQLANNATQDKSFRDQLAADLLVTVLGSDKWTDYVEKSSKATETGVLDNMVMLPVKLADMLIAKLAK